MLNFRLAKRGEAGILTALSWRAKAHWGYSRDFMMACRQELAVDESMLQCPGEYYVVAEYAATIIGFYSLRELMQPSICLDKLFVEPEFLRRGVGRALVEHAIDVGNSWGAESLWLESDPHAATFYRALGAVQKGEVVSTMDPQRRLPVFVLLLSKK